MSPELAGNVSAVGCADSYPIIQKIGHPAAHLLLRAGNMIPDWNNPDWQPLPERLSAENGPLNGD